MHLIAENDDRVGFLGKFLAKCRQVPVADRKRPTGCQGVNRFRFASGLYLHIVRRLAAEFDVNVLPVDYVKSRAVLADGLANLVGN